MREREEASYRGREIDERIYKGERRDEIKIKCEFVKMELIG